MGAALFGIQQLNQALAVYETSVAQSYTRLRSLSGHVLLRGTTTHRPGTRHRGARHGPGAVEAAGRSRSWLIAGVVGALLFSRSVVPHRADRPWPKAICQAAAARSALQAAHAQPDRDAGRVNSARPAVVLPGRVRPGET